MIPVLSPEEAAAYLLRGIKRGRHEVMAPLMVRVVVGLNYLFPYIIRWLIRVTGYLQPSALVNAVAGQRSHR
jgi:hypothetical protein